MVSIEFFEGVTAIFVRGLMTLIFLENELGHSSRVAGTMVVCLSFCLGDCQFESEPSPTTAHACGEVTGYVLIGKRSAHLAPAVDLGKCTLHLHAQK